MFLFKLIQFVACYYSQRYSSKPSPILSSQTLFTHYLFNIYLFIFPKIRNSLCLSVRTPCCLLNTLMITA